MIQNKIKYANFPERELKVVVGPNINATLTKTLCRMSIGSYEMSFMQQERAKATADAVKSVVNAMGRQGYTVTFEEHRDFVSAVTVANAEHTFKVWVTTPFELTQSGHLIWCKYLDTAGEPDAQKIGVSYKLSTSFTADEASAVINAARKNALILPAGEPYVLKGNPPPRFQKKAPADAAAAPAEGSDAPASDTPAG